MALALDGSTPASWTGTPADNVDITSASFTPPSGSLCLVCVDANSNSSQAVVVSVSDSLGGTWNEEVRRNLTEGGFEGHVSIWKRVTALSGSAMTVSVRRTNDAGGADPEFDRVRAKAYVITGQHATPIPTIGEGSSTTNNLTASIFTSAHANSWALVCAEDWNALGAPTSSDLTTGADAWNQSGVLSGFNGLKSLGAAGAKTANLNAAGSGAASWNWVAVEIREDVSGEFSGTLASAAATMAGVESQIAGFSGTLSVGIAALAGVMFTSNEMHGTLAAAGASLSGAFDNITTFAGTLSSSTSSLSATISVMAAPSRHSNVRLRFTNDRRKYHLYLGPRR